jgi:hypothetical protein
VLLLRVWLVSVLGADVVVADTTRLRRCWEVNTLGIVELGTFAMAVDAPRWHALGINRKLIGLEKLVHMYLKKPLKKGLGGSMNWTKRNLSVAAKACTLRYLFFPFFSS